MADERTQGSWFQNAELVGAAAVDSTLDAPIWLLNKFAGTDLPAPIHFSADVYASQTEGEWTDATGAALDKSQVAAAAAAAEKKGAIIDAAKKTAGDIAANPFALFPWWVYAIAGVAGAAAAAVGVAYVYRAFK